MIVRVRGHFLAFDLTQAISNLPPPHKKIIDFCDQEGSYTVVFYELKNRMI